MGKTRDTSLYQTKIHDLDHDGRGVGQVEGKTVFISGALPDEEVTFRCLYKKRHYDEGELVEVLVPALGRIVPRCHHFGVCGGCSYQHLTAKDQLSYKEKQLMNDLKHIGKVIPEHILPALTSESWGYRHRARLGVRYVHKKGKLLVGFRERQNRYLADLNRCEILHPSVGEKIEALALLIDSLIIREHIAQIEVVVGEGVTMLIFRNMVAMEEADKAKLMAFGQQNQLSLYLQPGGMESISPLWPEVPQPLQYTLPQHQLTFQFQPSDFTQINFALNQKMVDHTIDLLAPQGKILDLFCGIGNFTLPLSRYAEEVVGVEGNPSAIATAKANAADNGIANVQFYTEDLTQIPIQAEWIRPYSQILLDPPRAGALEVLPLLPLLRPRQILYISCNPATLARDAGFLVHTHGFNLKSVGVMDMFPHTTHVEAIALFTK